MGSSSSKVSRKLPTKPSPSWAGTRTDRTVLPQSPRNVAASETRDAWVKKDGEDPSEDPQFLEKLKQLGPVKVDHHMRPVPALGRMRHIVESRKASEEEAASHEHPRNRLPGSALFEVLEQRKAAGSREQLQDIANQYNLDVVVLERLARFANTPSRVEESRRKVVDEDGKERFIVMTTWEDPPLKANHASPAKNS